MKKKIIVAHLQLFPIMSGVQKVTYDELVGIDSNLFQGVLICKENGQLSNAVQQVGIPVYYIESLVRKISIINDLRSTIELIRLLKLIRPQILHTHSSKTGVIGRIAAKIVGIPCVHTVHGFSFPSADSILKRSLYYLIEYLCAKLDGWIVVMNRKDDHIAVNRLGVKRKMVRLIHNGVKVDRVVDKDKQSCAKFDFAFQRNADRITITMVGRLWVQKNPEILIGAVKVLRDRYGLLNILLVYVGDGELLDSLKNKVKDYGLEENVRFLGWRNDVSSILYNSDIFVLPSLWEGMPISILEAMAQRLPIVASDIPGNNELIDHEISGLLFKSESLDDLCVQLNRLCKSPDLRCKLGGNAFKKVSQKYSFESHVKKIESLYIEMVAPK